MTKIQFNNLTNSIVLNVHFYHRIFQFRTKNSKNRMSVSENIVWAFDEGSFIRCQQKTDRTQSY